MNLIPKTVLAGLSNWQTTGAGLVVAILHIYRNGGFDNLHGSGLAYAVAIAAVGFLAKDGAKTGAP